MENFRRHFFRLLAAATAVLTCHQMSAQTTRDTLYIYRRDTVYYMPDPALLRRPVRESFFKNEKGLHRPAAAARTNLLLPMLNIGFQIPVTNRWSLGAEYYYPWIPRPLTDSWSEAGQNCFQYIGALAEARLWLGQMHRDDPRMSRYRLLGHSIGLLLGIAAYDRQKDWTGQQGEILAAGAGYMYSWPLGKAGAVYMQLELAVGFAVLDRHPYKVHEAGGSLIRQKDEELNSIRTIREMHIGIPIKAGASIVVPFNVRRLR